MNKIWNGYSNWIQIFFKPFWIGSNIQFPFLFPIIEGVLLPSLFTYFWKYIWKRFWNPYGVFPKVAQMPFWMWPPTSHSIKILKKSCYLPSWKSLSGMKYPVWNYFKWNSNHFQIPFHLFKWKKSYHLHSRVLWWNECEFMEIINARWKFGKVILFPLIQHSKSFKFHSISHNKPHKQSLLLN